MRIEFRSEVSEEKTKCEKLTTTDDGQNMIIIVHLSLRLRGTKNNHLSKYFVDLSYKP